MLSSKHTIRAPALYPGTRLRTHTEVLTDTHRHRLLPVYRIAATAQQGLHLRYTSSYTRYCIKAIRRVATLTVTRHADVRVQAAGSGAGSSKRAEPLLVLEDVGKTHDGEDTLFAGLSLTLARGDKVAVVGPNGCGKSTLLRLLAGADAPDSGSLRRRKGTTLGYLPQEPVLDDRLTILEAVLQSDSAAAQAVRAYERALSNHAAGLGPASELDAATSMMNTLNGWALDANARQALEAVGCPASATRVGSLSGGQRRRVALAAALLAEPDILILDEPTNHMDLQVIQWMEEVLGRRETTLALVTHDRAFLEAVSTSILELDHGSAIMHTFPAGLTYDAFLQARVERRSAKAAAAAAAQTVLRRESVWMARQPKARQAKSKSRQEAFYELTAVAKDLPARDLRVDFGAGGMARQGTKVVTLRDAACRLGDRLVIRDFCYEFAAGERIGIVGPNGAGKSTLLDIITGRRQLSGGSREVGETTVLGYFTQHVPPFPDTLKIIDYIREVSENRKTGPKDKIEAVETSLDRLGFPRSQQQQLVGSLSGGQKRRLQLAAVLAARPNLLVLDEPTNDLDLTTVDIMEELLAEYKGVLLVVSHDRLLLQHLVDRLFVVQGDGLVRLFDGLYLEYLEVLKEEQQQQQQAEGNAARRVANATMERPAVYDALSDHQSLGSSSNGAQAQPSNGAGKSDSAVKKPLRLGFREKKEYEQLEGVIDELSTKHTQLEAQLLECTASGDFQAVTDIAEQVAMLQDDIDAKTERWLELAEQIELSGASA